MFERAEMSAATAGWQLSAGDFSELLRPLSYICAALASAVLLAQLRRRNFHTRPSLALALLVFLLTFLFPFVLLPLLLALWIFARRDTLQDTSTERDTATASDATVTTDGAEADESSLAREPVKNRVYVLPHLKNAALPLFYAAIILAFGAYFFIRDYKKFDAHVSRAHHAKLHGRDAQAMSEYRAALQSEDDAHTRKLLGLELEATGQTDDALAQFLAAERGGEADETLAYHIATTLAQLGRTTDAAIKYREFLRSPTCTQTRPPASCQDAQSRLPEQSGSSSSTGEHHPTN